MSSRGPSSNLQHSGQLVLKTTSVAEPGLEQGEFTNGSPVGSTLPSSDPFVDSNALLAAAAAAQAEVSPRMVFPPRKLINSWLEKRVERQKMAATRRKMAQVRAGHLCQLVPADHGYIDSRLEKERKIKASAQALPPNVGRATLCHVKPGGLSELTTNRASRQQFQRTRGVYRPMIVQFYGREAVEALNMSPRALSPSGHSSRGSP
eukprot:gnl/MRDRNA2_/MRDRNA2_45175_c0_seq2.p1 gnl/MRDRNA2_/MRDRNA2_45175_c0~~gnl/MRDRNA2_/MRDRNA2_45175_c0_seq2.p1  ORF type:complete len:206 (-),score=28.85 gnl/MRDRNA2_/MRDRNA2_45175_c0_seq2:65-682(-)